MARMKILRVLAAAMLLLVVISATLLWLVGRESSARWLAEQVISESRGQLAIKGITGSLYGPLQIDELSWETPEQRFELHGLTLDWAPLVLLLQRQVRLHKAELQSLRIVLKQPSAEPLQLPTSLRLPVGVDIPQLSVGRIEVQEQKQRLELKNLLAGVGYGKAGYRFSLERVITSFGAATAGLKLSETHPFALDGQFTLETTEGRLPYAVQGSVTGSLLEIAASATATSGAMDAKLETLLLPFEPVFLKQAKLLGRHLSPAQFDAALPAADLSVALNLQGLAEAAFQGSAQVENHLPGTVDKSHLPLREVSANLSGKLDDLSFDQLQLDLGEGGQFSGKAGLKGLRLSLDLATRNLNLQGLQSKLKPTLLAGNIRIDAEEDTQHIRADLNQQHYAIKLDARHAAQQLEIGSASVRAYGSELQLSGAMALDGEQAFKATGALKRFNPADFGSYPAAAINGQFTASGRLSPQWQAAIDFSLRNSQFRGHPLSAKGKVRVSPEHIWDSMIDARLAGNSVSASGSFGRKGDSLKWSLDADNLSVLDPELNGQVQATGILEGSLGQPSGTFELAGQKLRWSEKHQVQRIKASGRLEPGLDGILALQAEIDHYRSDEFKLDKATVTGQGRRGKHVLTVQARHPGLDMQAELAGGWSDDAGWSGELRKFRNQGDYPVVLRAPAQLVLGPEKWLLGKAELDIAEGRVIVEELSRKGQQLSSRGQFSQLSLAYIQKRLNPSLDIETSLDIGGQWSLAVDEQVNGTLSIARDSGDVTVLTRPKTSLGLSKMTLKLEAVNNRVTGSLDAAGKTLGVISGRGAVQLTRKNDTWGIADSTPIQLTADAVTPSLAWLVPLLGKNTGISIAGNMRAQVRANGTLKNPGLTGDISVNGLAVEVPNQGLYLKSEQLRADVSADGSFKNPGLSGVINASGLEVEVPDQGLYLKKGQLRAELEQDTIRLTQLVMHAGKGQLTGKGSLVFGGSEPVMQLDLKASKLEVLARPDRHLVLSGTATVAATGKDVQLSAKLKADRGLIELPKTDAPSLSDDVVVLGRNESREIKAAAYRTSMDLALDLGNDFYLKGRGLDAQLGGTIKVRAGGGKSPQANGSIKVVKGTYSAYGQRLVIDRGILNFAGPIDNPGLNILAMRKNQPVEAGVAVTGTALEPRVRLASNPNVPDSEKLSWLVLGHSMENTSSSEFSVLQAAAGALLSAGESVTLQSKIAHAAGLDQLDLSGAGGLESSVLTLGKRLSSKAYLTYEQGLLGTGSVVKINYTLTKRLSVRTQTGTDNAVDVFYTFSFR